MTWISQDFTRLIAISLTLGAALLITPFAKQAHADEVPEDFVVKKIQFTIYVRNDDGTTHHEITLRDIGTDTPTAQLRPEPYGEFSDLAVSAEENQRLASMIWALRDKPAAGKRFDVDLAEFGVAGVWQYSCNVRMESAHDIEGFTLKSGDGDADPNMAALTRELIEMSGYADLYETIAPVPTPEIEEADTVTPPSTEPREDAKVEVAVETQADEETEIAAAVSPAEVEAASVSATDPVVNYCSNGGSRQQNYDCQCVGERAGEARAYLAAEMKTKEIASLERQLESLKPQRARFVDNPNALRGIEAKIADYEDRLSEAKNSPPDLAAVKNTPIMKYVDEIPACRNRAGSYDLGFEGCMRSTNADDAAKTGYCQCVANQMADAWVDTDKVPARFNSLDVSARMACQSLKP